jgi:hypothetical protein
MRFIYLFYYIKKLDRTKYRQFNKYVQNLKGWTSIEIALRVIYSVIRYNISILEYFQFRFYDLKEEDKQKWAGTGYMYEYQLLMNPREHRSNLEDKRLFLNRFQQFINHKYVTLENLKQDFNLAQPILNNTSGKIVLKSHNGQCGWGIEVMDISSVQTINLVEYLERTGNNLVEEYVVQHPDLMRLSPTGLNTVRIFTQLNDNDEVELLGCRLRISINSHVDNMAAGNIAASIDSNTGIVNGPGVYSDITKDDEYYHPVSKIQIVGFQVPFWQQTIDMIRQAAMTIKECRSIGWDIAITEIGPELIEGNHDWCKLVWQLPVKQGLKPILDAHANSYKKFKL